MTPRFVVPVNLPLPLSEFLGWGPTPAATFPFVGVRSRYYHLARNAIWHGTDSLGLKPGDEVLMPSYHHGVELETLHAKGMTFRFYRIDDRMGADLDDVRKHLRASTRALYVIHYLGFPQPIGEFRAMADSAGIPLIEDSALSLFSRMPAGSLGSFGDIGIFCLYKSLPVPHGGLLALNRPDLPMPPEPVVPDRLSTTAYVLNRLLDAGMLSRGAIQRSFSNGIRSLARVAKHASRSNITLIDTEEFDVSTMDLGVRPVTRQIIGSTDAEVMAARRRANYARLAGRLDPAVRVMFPSLPEGVCPLSLPILVQDKPTTQRSLSEVGVETINMWTRHNRHVPEGAFPETDFLRRHVLELPIHQGLREEHIDYVGEQASRLARW